MNKDSIRSIYGIIFLLSLFLYAFSMWKYMVGETDWFVFVLSLQIMFLSLWGYLIVNKYLKK
jgi:hypothetical protein